MTVRELMDMTKTNASKMLLKDEFTGHEYTKFKNYYDREVTGIFVRIRAGSSVAFSELVAWIKHEFKEGER